MSDTHESDKCWTNHYCIWWIKKFKWTGWSHQHIKLLYWKMWDPLLRVPHPSSLRFHCNIWNLQNEFWKMPWTYHVKWRQLSTSAIFTAWAKALIPTLPSHVYLHFLFLFLIFFFFLSLLGLKRAIFASYSFIS